jgi:saccharopine dehydrogenase (NAD+, L-lysine-forming)
VPHRIDVPVIYPDNSTESAVLTLKLSVIGAGGVGQVIAGHLARAKGAAVKVGDIDRSRLREVVKSCPGATVLRLDAGKPSQVGRFISGSDVVVNASHPRFNKLIMQQAFKKKVNYLDLASLTPAALTEQLGQDSKWSKRGLVAIVTMGEDPGLSNIMARRGVDMLDRVSEVRVRDGETSTSDIYPFVCLFAPDVFLEEAVSPAQYFEGGEIKTALPMSAKEIYPFPQPLGNTTVYGMDHEEVHTLPLYLPKKPSYVDFKLALTDDGAAAIRLFHGIGLLEQKPLQVGKEKVSPMSVLLHLLPPPALIAGKIRGNAGILVEVRGEVAGAQHMYRLHASMSHDEAFTKHHTNATSYLTGTPAAVCALMVAEGRIENRGVIVPECLNAKSFIEKAKDFDIHVQIETSKL